MRTLKWVFVLLGGMTLFASNAMATQSSTILTMSNNLYAIARDLTTGMLPTAILLIAIGLWGIVQAFGKHVGEGIHQLTNIIGVGSIVFYGATLLTNATLFSAQM